MQDTNIQRLDKKLPLVRGTVPTSLDPVPRLNQDPRLRTAYWLLQHNGPGVYLLHKTTRAGATTSLVAEFLNRKEPFLVVTPTTKISTDTVQDARWYSDRSTPSEDSPSPSRAVDVVHCWGNHECLLNKQLLQACPKLNTLPFLPCGDQCAKVVKGEGGKYKIEPRCAYYDECSVTALIRSDNPDGYSVTVSKLAALQLASHDRPNTFAAAVLDRLHGCSNVLLDEAHELAYCPTIEIPLSLSVPFNFDTSPFHLFFESLPAELNDSHKGFEHLRTALEAFEVLITDNRFLGAVRKVSADAEEADYFRKHLSLTVPGLSGIRDCFGILDPGYFCVSVVRELVELIKAVSLHNKCAADGADLVKIAHCDYAVLYRMACAVASPSGVCLRSRRDKHTREVLVDLVVPDIARQAAITQFMLDHKWRGEPSRIIFSSATFGDFNYRSFVGKGVRIKNLIFGDHGDPMQTNRQMLVLSDARAYDACGRNSVYKKFDEDVDDCIRVLQAFEHNPVKIDHLGYVNESDWVNDDVMIVMQSKKDAAAFQSALLAKGVRHKVTYYRAPETIGVSCNARVLYAVGLAYKSSSAFDSIRPTKESSLILREQAVHADTWQAWSRVKSPNGRSPSVVFAKRSSFKDCEDVATWGFDRKVVQTKVGNGFKYHVECVPNISVPLVVKCNNFEKMLSHAENHISSNVVGQISPGAVNSLSPERIFDVSMPVRSVSFPEIRIEATGNAEFCPSKTHLYNNDIVHKDYVNRIPEVRSLEHLKDSIRKMRKNRVTVHSKIDFLRHFIIRDDVLYEQGDDGKWFKKDEEITDSVLQDHIEGKRTIGAVTVGPHRDIQNAVQAICIDIDAHPDKSLVKELRQKKHTNAYAALDEYNEMKAEFGDLPELNRELFAKVDQYHDGFRAAVRDHIREQIGNARARVDRLCETMHELGLHPLVEASGSPGSYHVWHFVKYVDAGTARDFGKFLCHLAGMPSNTEVFPKQAGVSKGGYGNQVKLPLALHRKHAKWSKILIGGEFVRDFDEIELQAIDITGFRWAPSSQSHALEPVLSYVDENGEEYESVRVVSYRGTSKRRVGFFEYLLTCDLTGEQGHWARVAIAREYATRGMSHSDIAQLFAGQVDFNFSMSLHHVESILSKDYGPWKWDTLRDRCGSYVAAWEAMQDAKYGSVTSPIKSMG